MMGNPALVSNKKGALYLRDKLLGFVIIKDRRTGNFVSNHGNFLLRSGVHRFAETLSLQ
jgi:hypothetical protein